MKDEITNATTRNYSQQSLLQSEKDVIKYILFYFDIECNFITSPPMQHIGMRWEI